MISAEAKKKTLTISIGIIGATNRVMDGSLTDNVVISIQSRHRGSLLRADNRLNGLTGCQSAPSAETIRQELPVWKP